MIVDILMKKIHFLFFAYMIFFATAASAQQTGKGYSSAVRLIDSGQTQQAMEELRPYLDYKNYGQLALYARYHFARAAYKNNQYQLAQATLQELIDNYKWEKEDDAYFLLAQSYFAQNKAIDGLKQINQIKSPEVQEEASKASYQYLSQNASVSLLVANFPSYQSNKGYSLALKELLLKQSSLTTNEKQILNDLNQRDLAGDGSTEQTWQKVENNTLDIAVVLPFNYQGGSGVKRLKSNNFVFELYQGIELAVKEAKAKGLQINVRTFDTERKDDVVRKVLQDPFFKQANIIIGPIYPEETELVATFADMHQIPFINPLSNISTTLGSSEYAYLFRPSTEIIVDKILAHSKSHLKGNRIALAYSASSRDELMASQFADEARKKGYQVILNQKVTSSNIRGFLESAGMKPGMTAKVDQVVIFSDDPYIASPSLALMESLSTTVPIFVMDSWLYFNFANFEMLDDANINYLGNNMVNFDNPETEEFRAKFYEQYKSYPGPNTYIGYDVTSWVASTINPNKGFDFQKNLNQRGYSTGGLGYGVDFGNSHSNRYVPVLKMEKGKLIEIK